jgi:hypothetical protein
MSTTDEWSAKKILVCVLIFWGGFALGGCYYLSGWWGSTFLSYLFAVIFNWIGWVTHLMWLDAADTSVLTTGNNRVAPLLVSILIIKFSLQLKIVIS